VPTLTVDFVVGFGDSITFGTSKAWCNVGGTQMPCDANDVGYPERLRALLQSRYPTQNFQVQKSAVPGEQATQGQARLSSTLSPAQDLVVILEGVNDLINGTQVPAIIGALRNQINIARNAGKQVVICTLPPVKQREYAPFEFRPNPPSLVAQLNAAIEVLKAELNVPRVDMTAAFGSGYASLLSIDGLHPNAAGYQRMAEAIRDKLVEQFEVRPAS